MLLCMFIDTYIKIGCNLITYIAQYIKEIKLNYVSINEDIIESILV